MAACLGGVIASSAGAQIATDGTLGPAVQLAGPAYVVQPSHGRQVGGNLYYSFREFGVGAGESALFVGPATVENILARVTGGRASRIDGALDFAFDRANFFLLNPAGVVFGAGSSINLNGAFHASTADFLRLGPGGRFDAAAPGQSVLTADPPSAFGFSTATPAPITVAAEANTGGVAWQRPEAGRTLALVGGDVTLRNARVEMPAGRVAIVAAKGEGVIEIRDNGLGVPQSMRGGTITLSDSTDVSVGNAASDLRPAGSIQIVGGRLALRESFVRASNARDGTPGTIDLMAAEEAVMTGAAVFTTASGPGAGGDVRLSARLVVLDEAAELRARTFGSRRGGSVLVDASAVALRNGARILTSAHASAPAGDVTVQAGDSLRITGKSSGRVSAIASETTGNGSAPAGRVTIRAGILRLEDDGRISTSAANGGRGGDIAVDAGSVVLDAGRISADSSGSGDTGSVSIATTSLRLDNDGVVTAIAAGTGAGSAIDIAADAIDIRGGRRIDGLFDPLTGLTYYGLYSGIYATSQGAGSGRGSAVRVRAGTLGIHEGGTISGITLGKGGAGPVDIEAERVVLTGGGLIHNSTAGLGAGGTITVVARESLMASGRLDAVRFSGFAPRGSQVSGIVSKATTELNPNTPGLGPAGAINVAAPDLRLDSGAEISTSAEREAAGGTVRLQSSGLSMTGGARISSESLGTGLAGNILIEAGQAARLRDGSAVTTEALSADGGDISLSAAERVHLTDSRITTSVGSGQGSGGNIRIDPQFVVLNRSQVVANAFGGAGGNIRIVAGNFIASAESTVEASSQLGVDGTVEINSPDAEVGSALGKLQTTFLDPASLLRESCAARARGGRANSLVMAGRGGLPPSPLDASRPPYSSLIDKEPRPADQAMVTPSASLDRMAFRSTGRQAVAVLPR